MADPLIEMAEFAGKACGIIARDLNDLGRRLGPLVENAGDAFRRGWREGRAEKPAAAITGEAPESA